MFRFSRGRMPAGAGYRDREPIDRNDCDGREDSRHEARQSSGVDRQLALGSQLERKLDRFTW